MAEGRRVGDFDNQAVAAAFDFHIADLDETLVIHGLGQRAIWPFGGLRNEAGNLYVLERKLVHQMTGGLWLMSDKDGDLNLVPNAVHSARGGVAPGEPPPPRARPPPPAANPGAHP